MKPPNINPAHEAAVKRMLAAPPQPKKSGKAFAGKRAGLDRHETPSLASPLVPHKIKGLSRFRLSP
jgi:hypothetical protein